MIRVSRVEQLHAIMWCPSAFSLSDLLTLACRRAAPDDVLMHITLGANATSSQRRCRGCATVCCARRPRC